jgi:dipeptidyl aminopeptidase/acylaminoacyl peptidase
MARRWNLQLERSIARDGTHLRRLTAIGGWNPSWSPDGTRLAFVADDGLYVIPARKGAAKRLFKSTRQLGVDAPAWSPDGKTIAFEKELPDLSSAIYIIPSVGAGHGGSHHHSSLATIRTGRPQPSPNTTQAGHPTDTGSRTSPPSTSAATLTAPPSRSW